MDLKQWIFENYLTREEAAKIIGISRSGLHRILNGERIARPATRKRIDELLSADKAKNYKQKNAGKDTKKKDSNDPEKTVFFKSVD